MRASHSEGPDDSKGADAEKGRQALNPILVEAMQRAERTDKSVLHPVQLPFSLLATACCPPNTQDWCSENARQTARPLFSCMEKA